jgi:acetoin utilization deacetylase AcuC-like enzyme
MKIFYAETHRLHDAPFEVGEGGGQEPMLECPDRLDRILAALKQTAWADIVAPTDFGLDPIRAVHSDDYLEFLRTAFAIWKTQGGQLGLKQAGPVLTPATFPPRRSTHNSGVAAGQAGYYIFDLSTPILENTYTAILGSANCALSAAQSLLDGERVAFALCRPPGHHAGRDFAGGYCYLNNAAIAAQHLTAQGKVAILDIDYHGGNGTQDIFYDSPNVLTISIHADPARQYPYFVGFADETGSGMGGGFHQNCPLPVGVTDSDYLQVLAQALDRIRQFGATHLVVSAGMDIYEGDPLGDFNITTEGIHQIGEQVAALKLPTAIIMEGGYNNDALGKNVVALLSAFQTTEVRLPKS